MSDELVQYVSLIRLAAAGADSYASSLLPSCLWRGDERRWHAALCPIRPGRRRRGLLSAADARTAPPAALPGRARPGHRCRPVRDVCRGRSRRRPSSGREGRPESDGPLPSLAGDWRLLSRPVPAARAQPEISVVSALPRGASGLLPTGPSRPRPPGRRHSSGRSITGRLPAATILGLPLTTAGQQTADSSV